MQYYLRQGLSLKAVMIVTLGLSLRLVSLPTATRSKGLKVVVGVLRIGHSRLIHSYLVSHSNPPICSDVPRNVPFSAPHILLSCLCYIEAHTLAFSYCPPPPNLSNFLTEPLTFSINSLSPSSDAKIPSILILPQYFFIELYGLWCLAHLFCCVIINH